MELAEIRKPDFWKIRGRPVVHRIDTREMHISISPPRDACQVRCSNDRIFPERGRLTINHAQTTTAAKIQVYIFESSCYTNDPLARVNIYRLGVPLDFLFAEGS